MLKMPIAKQNYNLQKKKKQLKLSRHPLKLQKINIFQKHYIKKTTGMNYREFAGYQSKYAASKFE